VIGLGQVGGVRQAAAMTFTLPPLPYAYDALEPHIDETTMRLHHDKHHQTYVDNLNKALTGYDALATLTVEELLSDIDGLPAEIQLAVRNNGGGHANHSLLWEAMSPSDGGDPDGDLAAAITDAFGSVDGLRDAMTATATAVFGSGWAWLIADPQYRSRTDAIGQGDHVLRVISLPNQDSPISLGAVPLLGIDVWEHAYYLKHQNRRPEYLAAFWNVVNWTFVAELHASALTEVPSS
jgi:superoxide dismutase, Fe-Mn family